MRFLIGQRSDTLSLKSLARSRLKCWTGWKCKRRTGQGHLSIFPTSCHGLILKHWVLMRQVQSCEQFPNEKPPEMRGKGGTLSGGQVTGDLPCRGARGTLSGGQCEGAPCLCLFPKKVGWLGTRNSEQH